jgi:hypothetical protein
MHKQGVWNNIELWDYHASYQRYPSHYLTGMPQVNITHKVPP